MSDWPELSAERDHETLALLHLAAQMIGKIRVAHAPWLNHGWHVALQPNARGPRDLPDSGERRAHLHADARPLPPRDCAVDQRRRARGGAAERRQHRRACTAGSSRCSNGTSFLDIQRHARTSFATRRRSPKTTCAAITIANSAERFRAALAAMLPVFARFRAGFSGKASPVHFWWGTFDLAVSRFSGRKAPKHPGGVPGPARPITREAYSHEVSSAGFWAGGAAAAEPFFYSYVYPEPDGFRAAKVSSRQVRRGLRRVRPALC